MKKALLFRENEEPILVSADDIKKGIYSRDEEFVDPEYEFKVQYVNGAKNNGGPYFRLYYSYEEYKRLNPDRATRYQIVANMRRYQESSWHKRWKYNVSSFCEIEKYTKNDKTNKWKYADAYYSKYNTCIEFQHSYIANDFEERNKFYSALNIQTIWLYDLPQANVKEDEEGNIELLENNALGFFRISENPDNLKKHYVYIQVKKGMIYRVKELCRKEIDGELKSTIRYFVLSEVYSEEEFIEAIKNNEIINHPLRFPFKPLCDIWKENYLWMIVYNKKKECSIYINRDDKDGMYRDKDNNCILYSYVNKQYNNKRYWLSHCDEKLPIWLFVEAKEKSGRKIFMNQL